MQAPREELPCGAFNHSGGCYDEIQAQNPWGWAMVSWRFQDEILRQEYACAMPALPCNMKRTLKLDLETWTKLDETTLHAQIDGPDEPGFPARTHRANIGQGI